MRNRVISRILIAIVLIGSSSLCYGQVVDSIKLMNCLDYKTKIERCDKVLMYQFGRKLIKGNEEYKIGFAGRKVAHEFACDPLSLKAYKNYKKRSIRGSILFWGGLASFYGIFLSNVSSNESSNGSGSIVLPMFLAEVSLGFGINDLIRKRKYMSKAIWHRNNYILKNK